MPVVCRMDALTPAERRRSVELRGELLAAALDRAELVDGYAFRLRDDVVLPALAEWIALERRCCPFFRFQLDVEGATGPVWLRLTGDGVRAFLAQSIRDA